MRRAICRLRSTTDLNCKDRNNISGIFHFLINICKYDVRGAYEPPNHSSTHPIGSYDSSPTSTLVTNPEKGDTEADVGRAFCRTRERQSASKAPRGPDGLEQNGQFKTPAPPQQTPTRADFLDASVVKITVTKSPANKSPWRQDMSEQE